MDISKIVENTFAKNYKDLCLLIGDQEKGGNAKKAHMKEIERYLKLEKQGYGFWIREKYTEPLEKTHNNETIYIINIENLILDLLSQDENNGQLFLSKNKLLHELNMINSNYSFCYSRIEKLSAFMKIEESNIEEFYSSAGDMMKRNIEAALNKLRKKALIIWNSETTICVVNLNTELNDCGKTKIIELNNGKNKFDEDIFEYVPSSITSKKEYRKANKEEKQLILKTEWEVLEELNCNNTQEVIIKKLWNKFNKKVIEILKCKANILFYYESYEITYNKDNVITTIERGTNKLNYNDKIMHKKILNNSIVEKININAENRHNNAIKYLNEDIDIKEHRKDILLRRSEDNYINDNELLSDTLIKSNNKDIRNKVRSVKVNK